MRVALMLSGELRSFLEPPSMLDALRQEGHEVDVFAHLPATDPGVMGFINFWKTHPGGFRLRSLQVSDVRELPENNMETASFVVTRPWYRSNVTPLQSILRHIAASASVGSMVRQAEVQDGDRYDWVVKTRYDLKFVRPPEQLA